MRKLGLLNGMSQNINVLKEHRLGMRFGKAFGIRLKIGKDLL